MSYLALIAVLLLVTIGPILLIFLIATIGDILDRQYQQHSSQLQVPPLPPPPPLADPVIGYKVADIISMDTDGNEVAGIMFRGVTGTAYDVNDHATRNYLGFHMYSSLTAARNHPQDADFLLEVLGYGDVTEHEDGYVTSNQRVLQVIVGSCCFCDRQATRIWHKNVEPVLPVCNLHSLALVGTSIKELAETTHTIDGHEVVFSTLTSIKNLPKTVPTVLEKTEEQTVA